MITPGAFIFDIDGTLVDSMEAHTQAWTEFFRQTGAQLESEDVRRSIVGRTTREILTQVLGKQLAEDELERLSEEKEDIYREMYRPALKPLPGLVDFLERSRMLGIPMAIASSAGRVNIAYTLDGLGITAFFWEIVGEEEVEHPKPHPEIYLVTAGRLGVRPPRCLAFEDSFVGIQAALSAGMTVIGLATTLPAQEIENAFPVAKVIRDYTRLDPADLIENIMK